MGVISSIGDAPGNPAVDCDTCTCAMVAAEALGLGTCVIGCAAPPLARHKELLKKYGLPEGNVPKIVLIMGYPAVTYRKAIRRPFQSVNYF